MIIQSKITCKKYLFEHRSKLALGAIEVYGVTGILSTKRLTERLALPRNLSNSPTLPFRFVNTNYKQSPPTSWLNVVVNYRGKLYFRRFANRYKEMAADSNQIYRVSAVNDALIAATVVRVCSVAKCPEAISFSSGKVICSVE